MADDVVLVDPWFAKAGRWVYDGWNVAQFFGATGLGAWASYVDWKPNTPLGPWLLVLAAFFAGLLLVRLVRWLVTYVRVVVDKPAAQIDILSSGTDKALLEIAHVGAPVVYWAEGRVIGPIEPAGSPRPPEQRFICELQPEEGRRNGTRLELKDGEWVHIVIAESKRASDDDSGKVLWVRRGS